MKLSLIKAYLALFGPYFYIKNSACLGLIKALLSPY